MSELQNKYAWGRNAVAYIESNRVELPESDRLLAKAAKSKDAEILDLVGLYNSEVNRGAQSLLRNAITREMKKKELTGGRRAGDFDWSL